MAQRGGHHLHRRQWSIQPSVARPGAAAYPSSARLMLRHTRSTLQPQYDQCVTGRPLTNEPCLKANKQLSTSTLTSSAARSIEHQAKQPGEPQSQQVTMPMSMLLSSPPRLGGFDAPQAIADNPALLIDGVCGDPTPLKGPRLISLVPSPGTVSAVIQATSPSLPPPLHVASVNALTDSYQAAVPHFLGPLPDGSRLGQAPPRPSLRYRDSLQLAATRARSHTLTVPVPIVPDVTDASVESDQSNSSVSYASSDCKSSLQDRE